MPPVKVLQLVGSFARGGAELLALALAQYIEGPECHFILCAREDGPTRARAGGAETVVIPKSGTLDPAHLSALVRVIRRNRVQLIHSHLFGNDLYGFLASCLTGCQIVHTIHGWDSFRSLRRRVAYCLMAMRAARVVAVSEALEAEFRARIGIREDKLLVIHNGIDVEGYKGLGDRQALRRGLGLPPSGPLVGMVGNIKPVKGIDVLLESVPAILSRYPSATILIVGGTYPGYEPYRASLDEIITRLGIRGQVLLLGVSEAIPQILATLDVYVVPSRSEGLSLALLEAMASGLPVVATEVGGTPGIIQDGVTGLLIPPESAEKLGLAVCRVLDHPFLAAQLGQGARKWVIDRHHNRDMALRYLALYREVLRTPSERGSDGNGSG